MADPRGMLGDDEFDDASSTEREQEDLTESVQSVGNYGLQFLRL